MTDLRAQVRALAERGLSGPEISSWLAVPLAEVERCLEGLEPGADGYDRTEAASFPASDPPPGPGR